MNGELLAFARLHLPVAFGLLMGTLARYGLVLDGNGVLVRRQVLGHLMMLGLCGMIAEAGSDVANANAAARAMAGAVAALCASAVVRGLKDQREARERPAQDTTSPPAEPRA